MQIEITRARTNDASRWLSKKVRSIHSQWGEDGIIYALGELFDFIPWCVEFGAYDGEHCSNTLNLINAHDWQAVLIEGDEEQANSLRALHHGRQRVRTLWDTVEPGNLGDILGRTKLPTRFGILSIDVDGLDYHIWRDLEDYEPQLVVIEFNPSVPNNILFVQDEDRRIQAGCSLRALIELGKTKGYELVATTPTNAFFVEKRYFEKCLIADNSIDAMHTPGDYELFVFQTYDGCLVGAGCMGLIWHNMEIHQEDIQPLPFELRKYPFA